MPIINKTKNTAAIYNRGREVVKVYDHGKLAWQKQTSIPDYLCFTALEAGTFTLSVPAAVTSSYLSYVEYSLDGINWNRTDILAQDQTIQVGTSQNPIPAGGKVYWRGSGSAYAPNSTYSSGSFPDASYFRGSADYDVSGNIMSLLYADDFADKYTLPAHYSFVAMFKDDTHVIHSHDLVLQATTLTYCCYEAMFRGCTHLVSAPVLPATTMSRYCYTYMFQNTAITAAPALPATSLNVSCYSSMFYGCTYLTAAPELPATTLANTCYSWMFRGCTNLETAPELKATTLVNGCYTQMFNGCSKINYIKCLATDISATNCITIWLNGVSSTGTFIQASGVTWPRGASGIPTGWVDVEKRTMPQGYKQVEYVANPNKPSATPMPIVDTGIVYNPLDTFEVGCKPKLDGNGYIDEMTFANGSSYATYIGNFFLLHRITSSTNLLQISENIGDNNATSAYSNNKVAETPQYIRVENTPTSLSLYLNGSLLQTKSPITIDPETGQKSTNTAKVFGYNSTTYNWSGCIYYFKWWRNGVLIADYVACVRESDNEPSFYDFVSDTYKVPTRTGFFTAGEEI